jgi:hypothetical protein
VSTGVRSAIGSAFAGRAVGSAIVTARVRSAVSGAFACAGRTVSAAVVTTRVRSAVGGTLCSRLATGGDVVIIDSQNDPPNVIRERRLSLTFRVRLRAGI